MLGRTVGRTASSRGDWTFPFRRLEAQLRAADVAFGNLECVAAKGATTQFVADPQALDGLRDAGFDVISLANNHTADAALEALAEPAAGLERVGIAVTGLQYPPAPQRPTIVRAGAIKVGFLAYSWSVGDFPPQDGLPFISRGRQGDMVADIERA